MSESADGFEELVRFASSADPELVGRAHERALSGMARDRRLLVVAATAYDRLRVFGGRPQKFGTQAISAAGQLVPWPVDPATTDTERAKWGVEPLARLAARIAEAPVVDKAMLRGVLRERRARIDDAARARAAERIAEHGARALGARVADRVVAAYWPLAGEADPRPLARALAAQHGARLALPVVEGDELRFRAWADDERLQPAGFGTLGPGPDAVELRPDVVLAPLVGCDRRGGRLGQGKGYYDRKLAALDAEAAALVVGIALDCQVLPAVPTERHDRRLDAIVTEREAFTLSG